MTNKVLNLLNSNWELNLTKLQSQNIKISRNLFFNGLAKAISLKKKHSIQVPEQACGMVIEFHGEVLEGAGIYISVNDNHHISLNSTTTMELFPGSTLHFKLELHAQSKTRVNKILLKFISKNPKLTENLKKNDSDVLVITPSYPSTANLYLCGFVHSRVREYVNAGLSVDVAVIDQGYWYQSNYNQNGVNVFRGGIKELKEILSFKKYKTVLVHFVSEQLMQVFDSYISTEQLIFICHGPEVLCEYLPNKVRPYFTQPIDKEFLVPQFKAKRKYLKKYSQKNNVTWVFVSTQLQEMAEKILGFKFLNSSVINNIINEINFPYVKKSADMRKKILIIRKIDNVIQHSMDQVVLAIRDLSRRPFFNDLTFSIYGDGNYFDEILTPIKEFSNVKIYQTFVPNDQIHLLHKEHGIMLLPSRHDAHAVAMSEAASSGLVVVGSNITSNPDFMNNAQNHTMTNPESPKELADVIERLYHDPEEFMTISKRMAHEIHQRCSKSKTIMKEIELIRQKNTQFNSYFPAKVTKEYVIPVLSIAIPAYNVESYIEKCLFTILAQRNAGKIEVLVVNDGSSDKTSELAKEYQKMFPGIVRVIDQVNGGHGAAINTGIKNATGTYFRLIDGDDWVDSENLAKQIDRLKNEDADIVLTLGQYEYSSKDEMVNIIEYNSLHDDILYQFDDLIYPGYGFASYGPMLPTSTYRLEKLKTADFKISEKKPYVDMEFNTFSLAKIETLKFYNLDIYRYLIGREGQTVSKNFWKSKYKDHEEIIFNIAEYMTNTNKLSEAKKKYVSDNILCALIDTQVFMFGTLKKFSELNDFLTRLKKYKEIYKESMGFIKKKDSDSIRILNELPNKITTPLHLNKYIENKKTTNYMPLRIFLRKCVKMILPYAVVHLWRRIK